MSPDEIASAHFAQRAMVYAQAIGAAARGSATVAERQAAEYTQEKFRAMGFGNVKIEPFNGLRSLWLFLALALGLALVGHAAFWLLRHPAGEYPALLVSLLAFGLSGLLIWRQFTFRDYPLKSSLPHAPSQNVIAVIPPVGEVQHRVVLVSHLDSHRAVFWFATDTLVILFALLSLVTLYGVYLAIFMYILAVLTQIQFFAWIGLALAFFHFLGWFTGVTADLGRYSPGANDNASSVGTLLALGERLKDKPLQNIETWLAFTGCEESGCDGIVSLIKGHGVELREALFIDFEMVGIGDNLCYIREEGNMRRQHIPQEVEKLLKDVGEPFGLQSISTPRVGAFTECGTLWEHGFKAACVSAHYPGSPVLPEWHRLTDTPSQLQIASLDRVQTFAWELLQRLDRQRAWF